jgi:phage shock protein A
MALLERVSTLIRANLNDLIDKAEDPEKMIKQLILDMENQLLQVKRRWRSRSPISTCSKAS